MPGSQEVYSPTLAQWETVIGDVRRVPLVTGGLVAGVTTTSRNTAGAFRLLAWLASPEISDQLAAEVDGMLPVHGLKSTVARGEFKIPVGRLAGAEMGAAVRGVFSPPRGLLLPRIPGNEAYLEALQRAVDEVVSQGETPQQALARAAASWEAITDHYGRDAQRRSYLRHLNLEE
jgi:ABC-type glycerol-3-phosphate transport system substrate-binding protein